MKIGFAFDRPVAEFSLDAVESVAAEYEDERTIAWLRSVLSEIGTVVDLPWAPDTVARIVAEKPDVIFNITEASGTRNRESLVPAVAEALDIPCTGSDAISLGLSLDKYVTKTVARREGIPTPEYLLVRDRSEIDSLEVRLARFTYPLMVKPNSGGSSMGITQASRVETLDALRRQVLHLMDALEDRVLVEGFVAGPEYAAGVLISASAERLLAIAEIRVDDGDPDAFYSIEKKHQHDKEIVCPADLDASLAHRMNEYALSLFRMLGCDGMARVDFRVDANGTPFMLELSPLPGLSPFYSIFPIQAERSGITPPELIRALIDSALGKCRPLPRSASAHV